MKVGSEDDSHYDETTSDRLFYWRITWARIVSLILWAGYAVLAVWMFAGGHRGGRILFLPVAMVFPLCLIWFADSFAGMTVGGSPGDMRFPVQPGLVAFCGWGILLAPILLGIWLWVAV